MTKFKKSTSVPKEMHDIFNNIISLSDAFCKKHLNEEYLLLVQQATAFLCRKRPSPILPGKYHSWACGIIYAMGNVNFLFDKRKNPYISIEDLCTAFGVSKSAGGAKSKVVRTLLKTYPLDPVWTLPSKLADNPRAWQISVNGFIVNAKYLSKDVQLAAYQKGLIPLLP